MIITKLTQWWRVATRKQVIMHGELDFRIVVATRSDTTPSVEMQLKIMVAAILKSLIMENADAVF